MEVESIAALFHINLSKIVSDPHLLAIKVVRVWINSFDLELPGGEPFAAEILRDLAQATGTLEL